MPNFYKQSFFGAIVNFHSFQRAPFGRPFRAAGDPKPTTPNSDLRPGADTAFHETMVSIVPFGPSVF